MRLEPILLFGDVHRPFHDQTAWKLLLRVGRALKPKHLVCMGDYLDAYSISSHSKHPDRVRHLKQEIADAHKGLDDLDRLGAPHKVFMEGNHCDRMRRYLEDKAPELFGLVDIPSLLRLPERGWTFTPYKHATRLGKLWLTHDVGSAGRFSTYKALDTFQHSVVTGHAHRLSYVVEGNATGEQKLSAQFGWLGDVDQIDYMHRFTAKKNWALGFGVGVLDTRTHIAYLTPIALVRVGRTLTCVVNGTLYQETYA